MVSDINYVPAKPEDRVKGLLGFVSLSLGPLRIDGICARRFADGRYGLSFPERRDGAGKAHPIVRPLTAAAREEIEEAVLGDLHRRAFIVWPEAAHGGHP